MTTATLSWKFVSAKFVSSKFVSFIAAAIVSIGGIGAVAAQTMPDPENGRYALSPVTDGVIRLDTRTGAVSTCSNTGTGWACYAVPDERDALEKAAGWRPTMSS